MKSIALKNQTPIDYGMISCIKLILGIISI